MNNLSNSNIIIGSKIALALAVASGSPVHSQFAKPPERKKIAIDRMARRCDSIKKRSRQLLDEIKIQDASLETDFKKINATQTNDGFETMRAAVSKMAEQHTVMHTKIENVLDEMMQVIEGSRASV